MVKTMGRARLHTNFATKNDMATSIESSHEKEEEKQLATG
ncbi:hypothetical protein BOVA514_1605 [Bacteroides ovatus]|nr:hypothetical protein BOVA514_1605 [Bacteroides ovatus]